MSKYDPLTTFLRSRPQEEQKLALSLDEIERVAEAHLAHVFGGLHKGLGVLGQRHRHRLELFLDEIFLGVEGEQIDLLEVP